jgi:hypothetical protein
MKFHKAPAIFLFIMPNRPTAHRSTIQKSKIFEFEKLCSLKSKALKAAELLRHFHTVKMPLSA